MPILSKTLDFPVQPLSASDSLQHKELEPDRVSLYKVFSEAFGSPGNENQWVQQYPYCVPQVSLGKWENYV